MYLETIEEIPMGKQIFINYGKDDSPFYGS